MMNISKFVVLIFCSCYFINVHSFPEKLCTFEYVGYEVGKPDDSNAEKAENVLCYTEEEEKNDDDSEIEEIENRADFNGLEDELLPTPRDFEENNYKAKMEQDLYEDVEDDTEDCQPIREEMRFRKLRNTKGNWEDFGKENLNNTFHIERCNLTNTEKCSREKYDCNQKFAELFRASSIKRLKNGKILIPVQCSCKLRRSY